MPRLTRWLYSFFAWHDVREEGVWLYQQNTITGARRAIKLAHLQGPKNSQWLAGGSWERQRPSPPVGIS